MQQRERPSRRRRWPAALALCALAACQQPGGLAAPPPACAVEFIVLGVAQDAGIPQIGQSADRAWREPARKRLATSAALADHRTGARYLFEATPDLREQARNLDQIVPPLNEPLGLSGVFVTHAHIGHYAGLMFAGVESANTSQLKVFAMPRMETFLRSNGPWSQLVTAKNITIEPLADKQPASLAADISITPLRVPHRDEFSETVGFVIQGPARRVLFLPDIDSWDRWQSEFGTRVEDVVADVDFAYVDATFFDNDELPGRDMTKIPHPRVTDTMARLAEAPAEVRARIRFIHFNHTNGLRDPASAQTAAVRKAGFGIAETGETVCLSR